MAIVAGLLHDLDGIEKTIPVMFVHRVMGGTDEFSYGFPTRFRQILEMILVEIRAGSLLSATDIRGLCSMPFHRTQ